MSRNWGLWLSMIVPRQPHRPRPARSASNVTSQKVRFQSAAAPVPFTVS